MLKIARNINASRKARMLTSIDAARDFEADSAEVGFDGDMRLLFQMARTILWMLLLMAKCGYCSRYCRCCTRYNEGARDGKDDSVDAAQDMERMLTIARTIMWMLLVLEMACPTCPALPCNAAALLLPERKQWEF